MDRHARPIRIDFGGFGRVRRAERWHLHAVPETEYRSGDVVSRWGRMARTACRSTARSAGGHARAPPPQVTSSGSDSGAVGDGGRADVLVHMLNFWQLGDHVTADGGTGSTQETRFGDCARAWGASFRLTMATAALRAMFPEWTLRGELIALAEEVAGAGPTRIGGYASSTTSCAPAVHAGVRLEYVESPEFGVITRRGYRRSRVQSEWVFLRAQQWQRVANATATASSASNGWPLVPTNTRPTDMISFIQLLFGLSPRHGSSAVRRKSLTTYAAIARLMWAIAVPSARSRGDENLQ